MTAARLDRRQMAAPLFILSFRHRDELGRLAERGGWRTIAARRVDDAEARFAGSGASVVVVDARGALDEGLEAVRALTDAAEANGAAHRFSYTSTPATLPGSIAAAR